MRSSSIMTWRSFIWTMAFVVAVFAVTYSLQANVLLRVDPLANLPAKTIALLRIDVQALRRSVLLEPAVGVWLPGANLRSARKDCGFDPLEGIEELVIWVDERSDGRAGTIGLIARGAIEPKRLAQCIGRLAHEEGIALTSGEIQGLPTLAQPGGRSTIVLLRDEGLIWAPEASILRVLRVAAGEEGSLAGDAPFAAAWRESRPSDGLRGLARAASAWKSSVARDDGSPMLDGIELIGGSVDLVRSRSTVTLHCIDEASAQSWARMLEDWRNSPAAMLLGASVGLSAWLREVEVAAAGTSVTASARLDAETLRAMGRVREALGEAGLSSAGLSSTESQSNPGRNPPTEGAPAAPSPDEVVGRPSDAD